MPARVSLKSNPFILFPLRWMWQIRKARVQLRRAKIEAVEKHREVLLTAEKADVSKFQGPNIMPKEQRYRVPPSVSCITHDV